jgi:hypothetical protein
MPTASRRLIAPALLALALAPGRPAPAAAAPEIRYVLILSGNRAGAATARISDVRKVALTVKDGVVFDPAAVYALLGVKPAM